MIIRRSVPVLVGLGVALTLIVGGCSERQGSDSAGQPDSTGQSEGDSDKPSVTTIDLTVDGQSVDLADATLKCYDHEGHLMVEAHNADDSEAAHFLMDSHQDNVTLSIGVPDGPEGVLEFEGEQTPEVTRDGDTVSVDGTIGEAESGSGQPQPFSIEASCAEFFDTPPDSSKIDSSDMPSIPSTCPSGQVVCYSGRK